MSEFSEAFTTAFEDLLTEFGDETTYRFGSGSTRTVDAIITTDPPELQPEGEAPAVRALVRLRASTTTRGVTADEVTTGRDRVDVVLRDGEAATAVTVGQVVGDSNGVLTLACY